MGETSMLRLWQRKKSAPASSYPVGAVAREASGPTRAWYKPRLRWVAAGAALMVATGGLVTALPSSPAKASGFVNSTLPVFVGDRVWNLGGLDGKDAGSCTVGAVMQTRGALTNYRSALRWLVLAGHCGKVGQSFITNDNKFIGKVDWVSSRDDDLLTVKVEPRSQASYTRSCFTDPSGGGRTCHDIPTTVYFANANGRVSCINTTPRVVGASTSVPTQSSAARFCGATTGRDLFYKPIPTTGTIAPGLVTGAISRNPWQARGTTGTRALPGDSGGPVFVLDSGYNTVRIYGITSATRTEVATGIHDIVVVPLSKYYGYLVNRAQVLSTN